jgi:hypothetical protein
MEREAEVPPITLIARCELAQGPALRILELDYNQHLHATSRDTSDASGYGIRRPVVSTRSFV